MILAEAIVVKVSHDLAGGVGAFSNTIDLIKMDSSFQEEGLVLLKSTGDMLNARLKFFRSLYGAENKVISASLVKDYLETLAVKIELDGKVSTRLQLALVAVGIDLLGLGGVLILKENELIVKGQEIRCNPMYLHALMAKTDSCTPENVNAMWLAQLVKKSKKKISLKEQKVDLILAVA